MFKPNLPGSSFANKAAVEKKQNNNERNSFGLK
jgi:hypothetical protein